VTGPASRELHVLEGICRCVHVGMQRVALLVCGLSAHRVEARSKAARRGQ
jgi:hypothetical protein